MPAGHSGPGFQSNASSGLAGRNFEVVGGRLRAGGPVDHGCREGRIAPSYDFVTAGSAPTADRCLTQEIRPAFIIHDDSAASECDVEQMCRGSELRYRRRNETVDISFSGRAGVAVTDTPAVSAGSTSEPHGLGTQPLTVMDAVTLTLTLALTLTGHRVTAAGGPHQSRCDIRGCASELARRSTLMRAQCRPIAGRQREVREESREPLDDHGLISRLAFFYSFEVTRIIYKTLKVALFV
jgi:hypothetical protein